MRYFSILTLTALVAIFAPACTKEGTPSAPPAVSTGGAGSEAPVDPGPGAPTGEPGSESLCQLEPCHGLDLSCVSGPPKMCTRIYKLGDFCRQFASCKAEGGKCSLVADPKFDQCKACVAPCTGDNAFACEEECRAKLK